MNSTAIPGENLLIETSACGACRHWKRDSVTRGECRLHALHRGTAATDRCENFKPKRAAGIRAFDPAVHSEEIFCGLGLVLLIGAFAVEKLVSGGGLAPWIYLGAYIFAGWEGVKSAWAALRKYTLDVDVLMVLAALGAALVGAPFEGALLLFLFSFSNVLQRYSMDRTRRAIHSLLALRPDSAEVRRGGALVRVKVEELEIGDVVVVRPGEQIPADGTLVEGSTEVDESSLTGESMPVSKIVGARLFAGTFNRSGGIEMSVTKRSGDSALARMVKMVREAQAGKSATQSFLERAEQSYALGVIVLTALVFLVPWWLLGEAFGPAVYRAMTIMVVASPCALVISTPATVLSAIGGAARRGILIKGGSRLDRAAEIQIVGIDKTGTLTVGKPSVMEIATAGGVSPLGAQLPAETAALLRLAAALETKSEHPLAHAILSAASGLGFAVPEVGGFQSTAGSGAEGNVEAACYRVGSGKWFREHGAEGFEELDAVARPLQNMGRTCVWFGRRDGNKTTVLCVFALADTIRPEAKAMIRGLHAAGVRKVVMLTGDHESVARTIAAEVGIDEIHASLSPEDKLRIIAELRKEGPVMMVGDGVNDAPALAQADLGMAMGAAGADVAMETADVVLMGDRLENIPLFLAHARRARRVMLQNLTFATAVICVLIVAALCWKLPLPLGVVGHEGSTVLVCLNGLRLLIFRGAAGG